ncbi:hypothetical protein PSTT_13300 [Puccinia striiformis]|uniref:Uncharacterized protein n=1 Tax=Puccinia striiformis TaxID=27350 RepID=A0A2S4USI6_9BASI|nr:hypothetical protein PSTT_13300 [Puccinia striiformis]
MDNWATPNSTPMPAFTANQQKAFDAAVEARTSRFEAMVSQLTNQVNSMKASAKPARTKPKTQPKPAKKTTTKQPTLKIKLRMAEPSSSRANPNGADFPKEFMTTKTRSPEAPELHNLQEFYSRFSNGQDVEHAARAATSPALINTSEIQLLQDARAGSIRYGRSVIHVGANNIRYVTGLMVRLALRALCPNLEEDAALLYNAAHRIAAITTFQELVAGQAYNYMNEKRRVGKNAEEATHKRIAKNREREFAIVNKFPKRYVDVLSHIGAHSDDEFNHQRNVHKIKTLGYCSKNASKFMRALDIVMKNAAQQDPSSSRKRRVPQLPRQPVMSTFTAASKGIAIDFYDPSWYHQLVPAQQKTIPNTKAVVFLPDASQSLLPKKQHHPDEKLTDSSFTCKYWDILVEPYGLLADDSSDDDSDNAEGNNGATGNDSEDEGHDLDAKSPDDAKEGYNGNGTDEDEDEDNNGEEEEEQYSDNDQNDEDVQMQDQHHGVDARTLTILEEDEEGW